ncbi:MAG TPA: YdcF family protein [Candidatus Fimenecus stercoravium]|nr:YdcF family protein [Candidatus Fimenecus stercoravium]
MRKKRLKKIFLAFICLFLLGAAVFCGINAAVVLTARPHILTEEEACKLDADCILVLGSSVYGNTLAPTVENRVLTGLALYEGGASDRLLMSGDHGKKDYDEVNSMKQYCVDKGVEPNVIFLDHAGFSTYDSMYRARDIFGVRKVIIVTQGYHLYRAVYIARALGLEAYGVAADGPDHSFLSDLRNQVRESLARVKDFVICIIEPEPTYLGEAIPISGSAELSDDKEYV